MDPETRMKRQSRRVIISEIIMVLSVVLMVVILALLVSGYWLGSDFKVERQGMLQISSFPTGANVEVDGDAPWFQRTNTSKVLSSGEHQIKLEKDGYDSWSKTINISEGLLYRLHYPRLFLLEREKSSVYNLIGSIFATVSPNREKMLVATSTTSWQLLNLSNEKITARPLDISSVFTSVEASTFTGTIVSADWDASNDHILFKIQNDGKTEWALLNVNNPKESVNLTKEFAADFSKIEIFDNSANNLLAVRNGNLHRIDVPSRQISAILVQNVESYDHLGSEIIYVANIKPASPILSTEDDGAAASSPEPAKTHQIGIFRMGDAEPKLLTTTVNPAKVFITHFYDDNYLSIITDNSITVYKKDNFEEVISREIGFDPTTVKVGYDGEFFDMIKDTAVATLDMESKEIIEWSLEDSHYGWLTRDMLYTIKDGEMTVYDFDGLNRRKISNNVSAKYPIVITNNKWLYYVSDNALIREIIAQ